MQARYEAEEENQAQLRSEISARQLTEIPLESQLCLGMPIPASIRSLFATQQRLTRRPSDEAVQAAIRGFGRKHNIHVDETDKACFLASGYDDVVVMLERPAKDHDYSQSCEEFVKRSPVLHGTDTLIRVSTHGSRTISDTSVLDAFMFKPLDPGNKLADKPTNQECHDLVQQIIDLKRPKAVLACTNITLNHPLNRFQAVHIHEAPCTQHIKDLSAVVIRCFHPGYCINHVWYDPRSRLALILGFALAFAHNEVERTMLEKAVKRVNPRFQE